MGYPRVKGAKVHPLGHSRGPIVTPEYRGWKHRMLQAVEIPVVTLIHAKLATEV